MVVRRPAVAVIVVALGFVLTGCNASALSKRELVFYFTPNATQAQHQAALSACAHVTAEATPEPFSTAGPAADTIGDVRFRIDHADDKAIAQLENCMYKQPGMAGVDQPDLTD